MDVFRFGGVQRLTSFGVAVVLAALVGCAGGSDAPSTPAVGAEQGVVAAGVGDLDGRLFHAAVATEDGVLIVGGEGGLGSSYLWDPAATTVVDGPALSDGRQGHTATVLSDGSVLVVGGVARGVYLDSAELLGLATRTSTSLGAVGEPRAQHGAVLLGDGRVLIAGGSGPNSEPARSIVVFDPVARRFELLESQIVAPAGAVVLLRDGRAAILGEALIVVFVPGTSTITELVPPEGYIAGAEATVLESGRVLLSGGCCDDGGQPLVRAVELDVDSGVATEVGSMHVARVAHTSTLLPDGRVLIVGGVTAFAAESQEVTGAVEVYDPSTREFGDLPPLLAPRWGHTATLLADGTVLVLGEFERRAPAAEIVDARR